MKLRVRMKSLAFGAIVLFGTVFLAALVYSLSPDARIGSVSVLAMVGSDKTLCVLMDDDDKDVRAAAANALVSRGERAVPTLVRWLDRPEAGERADAILILGRIGPPARAAIPALKQRLRDDPDSEIRARAAIVLGSVAPGDTEVIDELIRLLKSPRKSDREKSAFACRMLGADAKGAIPALIDATSDTNSEVREAAAIALTAIANSLGALDADLRDRSLEAVKRAIAEVKSRTLDAPQDQKESP